MRGSPKSVEQKRLTGRSPSKDIAGRPIPEPVVVLAASSSAPKPPSTLGDVGREAWDRLWTAAQVWLSAQTDVDVMTRLCEAHDLRAALTEQIAEEGFVVTGSQGQMRVNPLLTVRQNLEDQMTRWEKECGFTPASRGKLGYAEVKRISKLDDVMRKRSGAS